MSDQNMSDQTTLSDDELAWRAESYMAMFE
jgi:hypothetical protein